MLSATLTLRQCENFQDCLTKQQVQARSSTASGRNKKGIISIHMHKYKVKQHLNKSQARQAMEQDHFVKSADGCNAYRLDRLRCCLSSSCSPTHRPIPPWHCQRASTRIGSWTIFDKQRFGGSARARCRSFCATLCLAALLFGAFLFSRVSSATKLQVKHLLDIQEKLQDKLQVPMLTCT